MKSSSQTGESYSQYPPHFRCPTCKRIVKPSKQDPPTRMKFFPFCSERCKLIDLGAWFNAEYRIPARPDEEPEGPSQDDSSASQQVS